MTTENTGSGSPKYQVLPPNDPNRPEWGILSDSLGLKEHERPAEGATPAQASAHMRALLFSCLKTTETYDAVILKCAGAAIAGRMKEDTAAKFDFNEMMSFIRSRLWNRNAAGTKTQSTIGREHSSNDIISAWNPEAGGIGKYLSVNVSNILNRDWKTSLMELTDSRKVSLDYLEEKGRQLDTTGKIFEVSNGSGDSDAVDYVENDGDLEKASQNFSGKKKSAGAIEDEVGFGVLTPEDIRELNDNSDGLGDAWSEARMRATPARRVFAAALLGSRHAPLNAELLHSTNHPDYRLLAAALMSDVPEPELDEVGRIEQLRDLAGKVMALHCSDLQDYEESREALLEWNPTEVSFARYFPEVCQQVGESLDRAGPREVSNQSLQLVFVAEFLIIGNEISRQSRDLKPRPNGMSVEEWDEVTENAKTWLERECTSIEELQSPDRPDYIALSQLTGRPIDRKIKPEAMGAALKMMYKEWTDDRLYTARHQADKHLNASRALFENHVTIKEMNKRMETWDPLTEGFAGETMIRHLREVQLEMEQREEISRQAEAHDRAEQELKLAKAAGPLNPRPVPIPPLPARQNEMFPEESFGKRPDISGPSQQPKSQDFSL